MEQTWTDLMFAHWPLEPELIRALVPRQLPLDLYKGKAWIAVTPFELRLLKLRGLPLPMVRQVPELNVRTYVTVEEKAGVYFFSLDIHSLPAVLGARALYRLPYYPARMRKSAEGPVIRYRCERIHGPRPARFTASYRPVSEVRQAQPGSLEYFLVERYCLYTVTRRQRVYRADIHHLPWPLQDASAEIYENSMATAAGLALPDQQPVTHFSREIDVLVWRPRRVRSGTQG